MGVRPDYRQVPIPNQVAACSMCGSIVDPSDRGRGTHTQFHEAVSDLELAGQLLLGAVKRLSQPRRGEVMDLTDTESDLDLRADTG